MLETHIGTDPLFYAKQGDTKNNTPLHLSENLFIMTYYGEYQAGFSEAHG